MKNKFTSFLVLIGLLLLTVGLIFTFTNVLDGNNEPTNEPTKVDEPVEIDRNYTNNPDNSFNLDIIKLANKNEKGNYLISPYSIELALSMLRDGANNNSLEELKNVIPERNIKLLSSGKNISVNNGIFINETEKSKVKNDYVKSINSKYKAEVNYVTMNNAVDTINNWVNKNTYGMIKEIIKEVNPNYVLSLVNTVAIDVSWNDKFECKNTTSEEFINGDKKTNVEMMHKTYESGASYISNENELGIIVPYKEYDSVNNDKINLEFIAIMPKNGDINTYIEKHTSKSINEVIDTSLKANSDYNVMLSLPRFEYDYDYKGIINSLKSLGIKEVFDKKNADLTKMAEGVYVSSIAHKTHVEVSEKGTKAAAATSVEVTNKEAVALSEPTIIRIKFNKPFMYIIRDRDSKEMLFIGVVKEPNEWKGSTCE